MFIHISFFHKTYLKTIKYDLNDSIDWFYLEYFCFKCCKSQDLQKGYVLCHADDHLNYIKLRETGRRSLVVFELTSNSKILGKIVIST